jgi:type I restriction enzyme, R subunit
LTRTIEQELAGDPYAQTYFSELLYLAIKEASAFFEHPFKQYALFKDLENQVQSRAIKDVPPELQANKHASAYFGILRLVAGDDLVLGRQRKDCIDAALEIERDVQVAVAENSLNPQNIEAAIRKALLPKLFTLIGLDQAKQVIEHVVSVTRIGLSKGSV